MKTVIKIGSFVYVVDTSNNMVVGYLNDDPETQFEFVGDGLDVRNFDYLRCE